MSGIVVGIDGSHNASHALEWAMAEATLRKTDLTVITVHSVPATYWSKQPLKLAGEDERVAEARAAAEEAISKASQTLGDSKPASVTVTALSGFPAQTLVDASETADLVVVGSRGGGGFGALVLGSISSQVVHHAKCPVVVVPAGH